MPVTLLNPDGLMKTDAYRQVAIATGTRQVHIAGQVAYDAEGQLVARGDLAGQVAQALRNVAIALAAAGATFKDVVRLTFYVVDWKREQMPDFIAGIEQVAAELKFVPAPASLIGVSVLFEPGVLVEIEATAVVD
ncbi:RidA family protein [Corallococcus praedator]|uniref:RidA family protein n=1 Tax=Corallococcus praedator TaxID=2316724 RepID=A0ABX9QJF2_9BACT|nr:MULTISPECIES: RidA family protein [Corallococcus]RKH13889.1 RidA family protein [Corallococcus sp. CA047B]RKH28248.1 RidA family protein [Corallococcus sp. CA031C]RKI07980.1 RidA family protein [Corallococcus praedator]